MSDLQTKQGQDIQKRINRMFQGRPIKSKQLDLEAKAARAYGRGYREAYHKGYMKGREDERNHKPYNPGRYYK